MHKDTGSSRRHATDHVALVWLYRVWLYSEVSHSTLLLSEEFGLVVVGDDAEAGQTSAHRTYAHLLTRRRQRAHQLDVRHVVRHVCSNDILLYEHHVRLHRVTPLFTQLY